MSNNLSITVNDLSANERDQIVDLFVLAGINPTVFEQSAQLQYSIEIGINIANATALEGIFKYITKHIYTGEQYEN